MQATSFRLSTITLLLSVVGLVPGGCHASQAATSHRESPREARHGSELAAGTVVGFPQFPCISEDGGIIVFSWDGDLWSAPTSGPSRGVATRLTAHPALERRGVLSPDGSKVVFESDREGARNLYVMPVTGAQGGGLLPGAVRRLTASDKPQNLAGFSADGSKALFSSTQEPAIYRGARMFQVDVAGVEADDGAGSVTLGVYSRLGGAFGSAPHAAANGGEYVFTRGRMDFTRPVYRGSGDMDVYRLRTGADGKDQYTRLTSFNGGDGDGYPLPDGSVVFLSSRDGQFNVWKLKAGATDGDAAALTQLTFFSPKAEGAATIAHGARDLFVPVGGEWAVFFVWDKLYRLDLTAAGAKPEEVPLAAAGDGSDLDLDRTTANTRVSEAVLSPDGKTLAVVARGEVWVRSVEEGRPTRRVTQTAGRERELAWSPDGRVLYFASDETGRYRIYQATVSLTREDLAPPKPAAKKEDAAKDKEGAEGAAAKGGEAPASPEGEKAPAVGGTEPAAKGEGDKKDGDKPKSDSKKEEKKPDHGKRWAEALRFVVEPALAGDRPAELDEHGPLPSPDGKSLLYTRGLGDLVLRDLANGQERVVLKCWNDADALWCPDSRHVIYACEDLDYNSDIWILDTQAGEKAEMGAGAPTVNITRHPDNDTSPRLSADGKVLYFLSERGGENDRYDVYAVALDRKLDGLRPYELDEYFKKAAEAAKKAKPLGASEDKPAGDKGADRGGEKAVEKPAEKADRPAEPAEKPAAKKSEPMKLDLDDAYLRVRRLTNAPAGVSDLAMTPAGERFLVSVDVDGKRTLVSYDYKGEDRKAIDAASVSNVRLSLTGDKVTYVKAGQAASSTPAGGKVEALAIDAPMVIEIAAQQRQKFIETARIIGDRFYHPTLKGLDWKAITARYLQLAEKTRTTDEFNRVGNMLFGELDGSHLGISGGPAYSAASPAIGFLGADLTPVAGGYRVDRVIAKGPAEREASRLNVGDIINVIDGRPIAKEGNLPAVDLGAALAGRAGKETLLEVIRADPTQSRYVLITPVSSGENDDLRYWDEVARRREAVERLSGGKIGYLHIRGMSEPSVRDFERDLFAAANGKAGLIIDVRDNGGGWTADVLLSSLTAPRHAWTMPRGIDAANVPKDSYPRDRRLIYGYSRPISVMCNENSFSNAEIFSHAIKTIGRGKLVGVPTYGGVISTGAATLIDGTTVRTPFRGWYLAGDGKDMENNGAVPDVIVPQTPGDESVGRDAQLEAAVKELMDRAAK